MNGPRKMRRVYPLVAFFFAIFVLEDASRLATADSAFAGGTRIAQAYTAEGDLLTFRGRTMGTTYMVKVYGEPWAGGEPNSAADRQGWASETAFAIERELRSVNDQMSTYLDESEISRFNATESTDWWNVSPETAEVVAFALDVSERTGGAFDVTIGPLVDRWSFGAGERRRDVPSDSELEKLRDRTGYQHLSVRQDPPALRKDVPSLRVDLSAIAKGHGVDRVVDVLMARGADNVFVEIGGEVRVVGDKAGQPWKVGIQRPDVQGSEVLVAQTLRDEAMATSGDYRNFFEVDGVRYSHTIDPSTGRPVRHKMASASVIAATGMAADAWATAFVVLGPERSRRIADREGLSTLLVERTDEGLRLAGTGELSDIAEATPVIERAAGADTSVAADAEESAGGDEPAAPFAQRMLPVAILTGIGLAAVLVAMAVGVIFGRHSISGSCGGLNSKTDPDGVSRCSLCSTPSDACKELRQRVRSEQSDHAGV